MLQKIQAWLGKTPIAVLQLQYQKTQTLAAILGIAFTTMLIFMQIGFRVTYLDSLTELPNSFQGEVFLMSPSSITILLPVGFSQRRLDQVRALEEVESTTPLYLAQILWRNPRNPAIFLRQILVLGMPLKSGTIALPGVDANLEKLKKADRFLLDEKSRIDFDPYILEVRQTGKAIVETRQLSSGSLRRVHVVGLFQLGANTTFNAVTITSHSTFQKLFNRSRHSISLGVIKLKPGSNVEQVVQKIRNFLPNDVQVLSKNELLEKERDFYEFGTPIGLIFRFGLIVALLVGTVILYQILYIKVSKYIVQYATLKAIGFSHLFLVKIVIQEAFILAILGYIPGWILSSLMYNLLREETRLNFVMKWGVSIAVLLAISGICLISAGLAVDKLREANPADIFN
jgi:putative ABC transport system permease protein